MKLFARNRKKLARADSPTERIVQLVERHGAEAVIDIGANVGQYAQSLRAAGLALPIVSVEPGSRAHAELSAAASDDPLWTVAPRMALGETAGTATLNTNARSDMNSLKPIAAETLEAFPKATPDAAEEVRVERLDAILDTLVDPSAARLFVKLDTQGFEAEVIRGAAGALDRIVAMQLELSLVPLYQGEATYLAILNELDRLGYALHFTTPGYFSRPLGRQLQFDGFFVRRDAATG